MQIKLLIEYLRKPHMKTACKQIVYELHISSILNAVYSAATGSFLDHGKQAQTKRRVGTVRAQTKGISRFCLLNLIKCRANADRREHHDQVECKCKEMPTMCSIRYHVTVLRKARFQSGCSHAKFMRVAKLSILQEHKVQHATSW